jgi:hypothetical protein
MTTSRSRKPPRPHARPTPVEFIAVWQTSTTLAEVASRLRMTKSQCWVRAWRYRRRGVPLKVFPPGGLQVWDWHKLAAYADAQDDPSQGSENPLEAGERAVSV